MPFHTALGDGQIHRIWDYEYADTTARDADTTWNGDSANIGKCVYVTGGSVFMLLTTTPTWFEFGGSLSSAVTIYSDDGSVTGNRSVTVPNGLTLDLTSYNLTSSNFTVGADIDITNGEVDIEAFTGDGVGGINSTSRILISTATMQVLDQINSKGLIYASDYSANFTDRSIVDKGYADSVSLSQADQTLDATIRTLTGNNQSDLLFRLYDDTSTDYETRTFIEQSFDGTGFNNGSVLIGRAEGSGAGADTSIQSIDIGYAAMDVTDSVNSKGLEYAADYSSNFTDRSIVDKAYVDSVSLSQSNQTMDGHIRGFTGINESDLIMNFYDNTASDYDVQLFNEAYFIGTSPNHGSIGFGRHNGNGLGSATDTKSIWITYNSMEVTDSTDSTGLVYAADYSANFTARSIIDRGFIENEDWTLTADKTITLIPTTGVGMLFTSSTATSGEMIEVRSTGTNASDRVMVEFTNQSDAATGCIPLRVDNAASNYAAWLESTGNHALRLVGSDETTYETGFQIAQRHSADISYWDFSSVMGSGGTSGDFYFRYTNISDASLEIMHVNAVSQAAASITIGSATDAIVIDYGQDVSVQYSDRSLVDKGYVDGISLQESDLALAGARTVTSTQTTSTALILDADTTTADVMLVRGNDLTTGAALRVYSNSANTSSRNLLYVHNDNALATDTYPLYVQNDAATLAAQFVTNASATVCVGVTGGTVEYAADYSADYTDRALVDKAYVDQVDGPGVWRAFLVSEDVSGMSTSNSFAYGNGSANSSVRVYVPTGYTCEVEALTYKSTTATTATLGIRKNGGAWISGAAMSGAFSQTNTFTGSSVADGDYLDVRPTAVTTGGANMVACIVLKYTPS